MREDEVLDRFMGNGISRRYVLRLNTEEWVGTFGNTAVYDQRENRFVPREEWDKLDADARMTLK